MPFRVLFAAAAAFTSLGMLIWGAFLHTGVVPPGPVPPVLWHAHAMVFGFASALIGGFLLTAAGNWTGRPTTSTAELLALCAAWLAARLAMLLPLTPWLACALDLAYLLGLSVLMVRSVVGGRNTRNYFVVALLLIYAALDATFFVGLSLHTGLASRSIIWTVDWLGLLMLVFGGRVIPYFTRRRLPDVASNDRKLSAISVNAGAGLALFADVLGLAPEVRGALWLMLALLTLTRLATWRSWRTLSEPMLWALHLGYTWLGVGMGLRGLALLGAWAQPEGTALHGITIGALGTLGLAMMTRVAQGHSGAVIASNRWLAAAFLLPSAAAVCRLTPFSGLWPIAAVAWAAAFMIYLIAIGPLLVRSRPARA